MNIRDVHRSRRSGFTLVEVAISIAVVAFALVAIMGVLPTGMQVQKENSEETIINQEARLLIEAIRSGATNVHSLAGNLEWIQVYQVTNGVSGADQAFTPRWFPADGTTINNSWFGLQPPNLGYAPTAPQYSHSGARDIIGHLSAPSYDFRIVASQPPVGDPLHRFPTNWFKTKARFLANSGQKLALEANNARNLSFSYLVTSEIFPNRSFGPESVIRSNNVHELRLTMQWPVYGPATTNREPRVGKGKAVFRTTIAGELVQDGTNFFFHNQRFGRFKP